MNTQEVTALHNKAMALAEEAMLAKLHGQSAAAAEHYKQALEFEKKAAQFLKMEFEFEPTRSILLRSAAALAVECNELQDAEKLIALALIGNPEKQIAEELRDLLEKVNFERHLALRGVHLMEDEMQLSISGNAISLGMAETTIFLERISILEPLVHRTAERLKGRPFRKRGPLPHDIKSEFSVYLSVPRAASFAISVKITQVEPTLFPGIGLSTKVIDEIFNALDLLNKEDESALKAAIPDENYFSNFMGLARGIAPDGDRVKQVGITIIRDGLEKSIALRRTRSNIVSIGGSAKSSMAEQAKSVVGVLKFADSTHEEGYIKVIDYNEHSHKVRVPDSLMSDIVRPLWGKTVRVDGVYADGALNLQNIEAIEESE